jgi:hypothetical protein
MTRDETWRQLGLISDLLDSIAATDALKPDLPFVGAKLKWLTTRVIPNCFEHSDFGRTDCLVEVARLQERWAALYFETGYSSPKRVAVGPSRGSSPSLQPWTAAELRFIEKEGGFDDTAIRLVTVWGRIPSEAREDGRWVVRVPGGNVYDVGLIRERLGKVDSSTLHRIAEQAILLSAGSGLRTDRFDDAAESIGPLVPELFSAEERPAHVVWRLAYSLMESGWLHLGAPAHRPGRSAEPGVLHLTDLGFRHANSAFHAWWVFSKESGYQGRRGAPAPPLTLEENDIPF